MKAGILSLVIVVSSLFISSITAQETIRVEKDLLGPKEIPADAYYGVQTARALENFRFPIYNQSLSRVCRGVGNREVGCGTG